MGTGRTARLWIAGGVLVALAVVTLGWFVLVSPQRSSAASVRSQTAQETTSNATLSSQIAQLQAQAKGLIDQQAQLEAIGRQIPADPQLPALIDALSGARDRTGVDLTAVTPSAPVAPSSIAAAASPAAGATATTAGTAQSAGTAAAAAATGTADAASYSTIPLTLTVIGDYSQLTLFLDQLETIQRLYVVSSVAVTALKGGSGSGAALLSPDGSPETSHSLTATIIGNVFDTTAAAVDATLPALNGAVTTGAAGAPANLTATPTATN